MQLPSTKQLRYLVALDEHRHFGRAASACFVSQSAFSIAIKELESTLGVQLVDRTNKRVTITRMGQEIVTQARLCLRDLESLVELARGGQSPLSGALHLGIIPTIAPFLLPRVLPVLRRSYPELRLFIQEGMTDRIYEALMRGTLDALVIALPYDLRNVETRVLFRDHFVLAYRDGTELVEPRGYAPSRLQNDSVLLLEDGHCLRDQALKACRIRNMTKVNQFSASSLQTLVQMVDSDLGVTFLPEMALASPLLKGTRIKTLPLKDRSFRDVALAWRKGSGRENDFALLVDLLSEHGRKG